MRDGISKVKSEIKGVMGIMQNNISKVLDRGAKLEDLQDKSGINYLVRVVNGKVTPLYPNFLIAHCF